MQWAAARAVVESLRRDTRLYLPPLSYRRGFSSARTEHLLNGLVGAMPLGELYLEVGTCEGRTLEAAAVHNEARQVWACDPGAKYHSDPDGGLPANVRFYRESYETVIERLPPDSIGCTFYDADHSTEATCAYLLRIQPHLTDEAVLVLDDWDRTSVREGAYQAMDRALDHWRLLHEMPEYTDGLTTAPQRFGYYFGCAVFGYRR